MRCPNPECDSFTHRVQDTDGRPDSLTMRTCICPKCGKIFSTVEYYVDSGKAMELYMEYVKPGMLEVEKARRDLGTVSD